MSAWKKLNLVLRFPPAMDRRLSDLFKCFKGSIRLVKLVFGVTLINPTNGGRKPRIIYL